MTNTYDCLKCGTEIPFEGSWINCMTEVKCPCCGKSYLIDVDEFGIDGDWYQDFYLEEVTLCSTT